MNDLAEKALHVLDVARRQIVAHPMVSFASVGLTLSCVIVVAGGQVNAGQATRPLSSWLGLQDTHGVRPGDWVPGAVLLGGVGALVITWLLVVEFVRRHEQPAGRIWSVAAAWALPLALGPPLMGTSVQTYAAFGLLQRRGLSPYEHAPARLGAHPVVAAIEPGARTTASASGSLGSLVQHAAISASGGSALGALLLLRVLGVVVAVVIGRLAIEMAGAALAPRALTLTVLNPLVLLYVVSAARLDGLMIVFALGALLAAGQRRWLLSIVLACVAGSVFGPAFLIVPVVITGHWLGRRTVPSWLLIGRDVLVAAVTTAAAGLIVPDGFGWLWTVHKQFSAHTPYSVAGAVAKLFTPIVRGASYDDLAAGGRIAAMTAMVFVVGYLLATARQRALERTAAYCLLALALLAPVLHPWYLLWPTALLAATANGSRRVLVLALCAWGCVLYPPGFSSTATDVLTGIGLVVVVAATALSRLRPSGARRWAVFVRAGGAKSGGA